MHLRSGTVIGGLNASAPSRVTTQGSGTQSVGNLEAIQENPSTDSQSDTFSTFGSEMDQASDLGKREAPTLSKGKMLENPFDDPHEEMDFNVQLLFQYENVFGAMIYKDPLGRYTFKTDDNRTPFNKFPMVNYQGDLYIAEDGSRFQVTKYPQQVDTFGVLQAGPIPSQARDHDATTSGPDKAGTSSNPKGWEVNFDERDVSFKWNPMRDIKVTKVFQDNVLQEVFKDSWDVYYATTRLPHLRFLVQHTLIIEQLGIETRIRDEHGNEYRTLEWNEVRNLTWKGRPLFSFEPPSSTIEPGHVGYSAETNMPNLQPSFSEWTTARGPPPPRGRSPIHERDDRRDLGLERLERPRHPMEAMGFVPLRDNIERGRAHRRHEDDHRRVRPSTLQKLVKKYDGSGDPHDHVAAFRQAVHAEQVRDTHTQIEGFGLTLESKALTWFQTLEPESKVTLTRLEKDFVAAFSKMGIKHNAVALIYSFKQKDHETVRDCVNRLKQYIARCPEEEKPSQARLISSILEGLKNRTLYAHLYARKHTMFKECCLDAMDYDDNFDLNSESSSSGARHGRQSPQRSSTTNTSQDANPDQLVDMVLRRLGQTYRPPYRPAGYAAPPPTSTMNGPYACGICAKPHKTEQCPSYMPGANNPPTKKWCDHCRWNLSHITSECLHIARMVREREAAIRPQGFARQGYAPNEQAKPVLGAQPPPPGSVPVRYVEAENQEVGRELVCANPYYQEGDYEWPEAHEEVFCGYEYPQGSYTSDTTSMMLLGPMPTRTPQQYPPRRSAPVTQGIKCFKCGGDHYARDCPEDQPQPLRARLPPIERYCAGCCVEHFPKDCPVKQNPNPPQGPKTSLNYIGVVPSPSNSESEHERASLNVVTRAQSRQNLKEQTETSKDTTSQSTKKRGRRRTRSRGSKKAKGEPQGTPIILELPKEQQEPIEVEKERDEANESTRPSSGGSVIVDKVHEPLQAALDAYNSRVTPLTEIPKKLQEYPNPREEKVRLAVHQQLIRDTQTILEGPPPPITRGHISKRPDLETIPEVASSKEREGSVITCSPPHDQDMPSQTMNATLDGIPEMDEQLAREMWEEVQKHVEEQLSNDTISPPFSIMDLEQPSKENVNGNPLQEKVPSFYSQASKETEPSYLGQYIDGATHLDAPSIQKSKLQEFEDTNLQAVMSTQITCTLPFVEWIKLKPQLWHEMGKYLEEQGILKPHRQDAGGKSTIKDPTIRVPLNKVGEMIKKDEGNTTLPVEIESIMSMAILDSGAGISIATKTIWEKWGKPKIRRTHMNLQLADGSLENPIGLLEITVKSCGIEYEHIFAIVDFCKNTNYEVILGRPFMRQFRMVQDWGYNYLYLRHETAVTRINLHNHSYRDVTHMPMEEFDSASSEESDSTKEGNHANLWMCDASKMSMKTDGTELSREVMDPAYVPIPYSEEKFEPVEWPHCLATLDVSTLNHGTKFCDLEGCDIIPIRMVMVINDNHDEVRPLARERFHQEEVSIEDLSLEEEMADDEIDSNDEDFIVPESELEKVRMLLKGREEVEMEIPRDVPKRKFCKSHQKFRKQEIREKRARERKEKENIDAEHFVPPKFSNKNEYLYYVGAEDSVKEEVKWRYGFQLVQEVMGKNNENPKKSKKSRPKRKSRHFKANSVGSALTKVERKALLNERKKMIKTATWSSASEDSEENENMDMPDGLKKYTIQDRKIILQKPVRQKPETPGVSYDGPEDAKQIDLSEPGEEPRKVWIATDLSKEEEDLLVKTLREYRDVFAWSYKDLKGVDPDICQHTIPMREDAKPSKQRPYTYNENFGNKIKEEIAKLLEAEFIYEIEHTEWVSPIVIVPKKNGKLRICVNLKKVNAATIRDHYPLPIADHVLERVAGKKAYSFLDGFSGYNQLSIKEEDQHKTAFATEWGVYAYRVMPFGLTNAPATFQRLMSHAFKEYLRIFLEIFMDDLCVHSLHRHEHIEHLRLVFEKCRVYRICLNPEKYNFMVRQGKILGHIVSENGISTDEEKIRVIVELPRPLNAKGVQVFMGHCGYYRRFIYMYAEIARPLYALLIVFEWSDDCEKSFQKLKNALISAPILKAPDWNLVFHVHIDASAYAIGCILAQPHENNMDFPVCYAS